MLWYETSVYIFFFYTYWTTIDQILSFAYFLDRCCRKIHKTQTKLINTDFYLPLNLNSNKIDTNLQTIFVYGMFRCNTKRQMCRKSNCQTYLLPLRWTHAFQPFTYNTFFMFNRLGAIYWKYAQGITCTGIMEYLNYHCCVYLVGHTTGIISINFVWEKTHFIWKIVIFHRFAFNYSKWPFIWPEKKFWSK